MPGRSLAFRHREAGRAWTRAVTEQDAPPSAASCTWEFRHVANRWRVRIKLFSIVENSSPEVKTPGAERTGTLSLPVAIATGNEPWQLQCRMFRIRLHARVCRTL